MKNTLKLTFGIVLTCLVWFASAQQRPEPPSPEEMLKKVTKDLSLSEEQVSEWETIHEKYSKEMRSNPRETMSKVDAEVKEILTDEQWKKFEQMKAKGPRRREGN